MEVVDATRMEWQSVVHSRQGVPERKIVQQGEVLAGVGFEAALVRFKEGDDALVAPRHRHDFEQIRMSFGGHQDYGQGQILHDGWVGYFPAGAPYGPERLEGGSILLIQWSPTWVHRDVHDAAVIELQQHGEFHDGIYTYFDENGKKHNKDGMIAVWEHVYQRRSEIPKPRYPDPIFMNPEAFDWVAASGALSVKVLGRFTERDVVIAKVRWDEHGFCPLSGDRTQCVFVLSGSVLVDGQSYGRDTTIWSYFNDSERVEATEGTEVMCFAFPPTVLSTDLFESFDFESIGV